MTALNASGLGKRYRRRWALSDCTLQIPEGRVAGLVGPNGAGKTTLLHLAVGLLAPTTGTITVLDGEPASGPAQLAKVGFVAQDTPVYAGLSVADHLRMGAHLNPGWDAAYAQHRVGRLGLDPAQRAGKLSGGQRAQLALTLAIAKRPRLLILDEPVASLDPLARREFLQDLMEAVAEQGLSVILSSHLVADLERVCDYLIVLAASRVQIADDVDALLASHHRLIGPRRDPASLPGDQEVIQASHTDRQSTLIVRTGQPVLDPAWTVEQLSLEDLVLAYMSQAAGRQPEHPACPGGAAMIWMTWRQFRVQALVISALLAILAAVLLATGLSLASRYHASGIAACAAHGDCGRVATAFLHSIANTIYRTLYILTAGLLLIVPAIIGIFWGAPLIAHELESGTYRLAWNQSVTRDRWLTVKLGVLALAAMTAAGLLSLMIGWWAAPIEHASLLAGGGTFAFSRFNPVMFDVRGITPIGYAAFAFTLGVFVGVIVRRTLPAMAITLTIFAVLQIAMSLWIRPHLITPERSTVAFTASAIQGLGINQPGSQLSVTAGPPALPGAWIYSNPVVTAAGSPFLGEAPPTCRSTQGFDACASAIAQMHLQQVVIYQPASRYWTFQWLELGIFLTATILLASGCFWWVRPP